MILRVRGPGGGEVCDRPIGRAGEPHCRGGGNGYSFVPAARGQVNSRDRPSVGCSRGTEVPVQKRPTIRDVAQEAGVSVAVVSRVLNDGTGPVAPQTRARVVEVIERLGFRPRAAARELQQQSSTTIGLVLADLANPFFSRLADRVVWEARARGIHAVLLTTQEDPHLEAESLETLIGRSVGSVIATPTGGNH